MTTQQILFIDSRVAGYETLIAGLDSETRWHVLDPQQDGVAQIERLLADASALDAIQIISHGAPGTLYLGSTVLNSSNLSGYAQQLQTIGSRLTATGDILLYGCNVAQGEKGAQFISALAQATGADVAASSNATGATAMGGDWVLEQSAGVIQSASVSAIQFRGILADTMAPTLTSLSIPSSVNVSSGTAGLTISGTATDDLSGVEQVVVWFDKELSYSSQLSSTSFNTYNFLGNFGIWDSWSDGASTQTYGISSINSNGIYNVTSVDVKDVQGNTNTYYPAQLAAMGINTKLNLTGATADTTAPTLTSLSIPSSVNVSSGTAGLTISGTATDDISGVEQVVVWFDKELSYSSQLSSTSFNTYNFLGNFGIWDSWSDGASTQTYGISSINSNGIYNVTSVDVKDVQGNTNTYYPAQLAAMGINTKLNLTGATADITAPTVTTFSPTDGAMGVGVASNIVLTFNEAIARGTGTIEIRSGSATGALVESFNATNSSQLTVSGNQLTIDPSKNLAAGTSYFVVLPSGAVRDTAGNAYAGTSAYDFTTAQPVNSIPTGNVIITGTATQGQALMATHNLADLDGLGTITYQWNANGAAISGATGATYTLTPAEVGKTITVTASYTDGKGTAEAVTSSATAAVTTAGVNTITGNSRSNTLLSTVGDDVIDGGAGLDTVSYTKAIAAVSVTLASNAAQNTGGAGTDTLLNIENLTGSKYHDKLTGNAGANRLNGGAGKDTLTGNAGNDVLTGGAGNDTLLGGEGNDILIGGTGKDVLTGGAGKDVFKFNSRTESGLTSTQRDVITDFVQGQDKIDLSAIDANSAVAGKQAFTGLIAAHEAFSQAGQLRLQAGVLYGNIDADAAAEFSIALTGVTTLAATDFIL